MKPGPAISGAPASNSEFGSAATMATAMSRGFAPSFRASCNALLTAK